MTAVAARGLAVGRGATAVVRDVALVVAPGERLALVGGNGAGKTTLLRALAGVDAPHAGAVAWSGRPLPRGAARTAAVGVVFQGEPAARFDVRTMVTLGLALDGPPAAPARARVARALAAAGLTGLAARSCATLSGGEAQRVLLARALVADPALVVLDEPTSHLDLAHQAALVAALDALRGTVAVVLATHDLDLAATCDRVALLAGGRVVALGPPADVLTPAHLAAALGVAVERLDDPAGGAPFLRVRGPSAPRPAGVS